MIDDMEEDEVLLPVPVRNEENKWNGLDTTLVELPKEDYLDEIIGLLEEAGEGFTLVDALESLGVCPAGFADPLSAYLISLESAADKYSTMPGGGGILDEAAWIFDGFQEIRIAKSDYYLWRARRAKSND